MSDPKTPTQKGGGKTMPAKARSAAAPKGESRTRAGGGIANAAPFVAAPSKAPVKPLPPKAAVKSVIELTAAPTPTLDEKIKAAVSHDVATDQSPAMPAAVVAAVVAAPAPPVATPEAAPAEPETDAAPADIAPTQAPAPAAAATEAAPEQSAARTAEPAPAVSAEPEAVVRPTPDPVAAFRIAPVFTRGIFDMATTYDAPTTPAAAAEKVQAMFGGLNDRAKTAMEKGSKIGEELTELTKGNVEALVASGKVAAKGAESLAQEAVEYGKKNFESATSMFKSLAGAKTPTELFQLQSEFAKSSFDSAVAEASKLSEAWLKLAGEIVQPISNRYAVAADKIKVAAL